MIYKPFCMALTNALIKKDWTQIKLAEKTKIHRNTLNVYINGKVDPTLSKFVRICEALDISPNEMLRWKQNEHGRN